MCAKRTTGSPFAWLSGSLIVSGVHTPEAEASVEELAETALPGFTAFKAAKQQKVSNQQTNKHSTTTTIIGLQSNYKQHQKTTNNNYQTDVYQQKTKATINNNTNKNQTTTTTTNKQHTNEGHCCVTSVLYNTQPPQFVFYTFQNPINNNDIYVLPTR